MTGQSMFQAKKESLPLQTSSLFRRQAAQAPVEEREDTAFPVNFGRDFSGIPFKPVHPAPALGPSSISCPFTPQRCPFGGACHACPPKMQAKLKIGQQGDKYEQEADRVAEQVMRMPEPKLQRKCSAPGCKDEEEKKLLQTKPANIGEAGAQVDHPLIQNVLSSPGQPLDAGTRSFMEPRFGQDFSGVRVHVGSQAAESARAVNARAYTVGKDVVFGAGQYTPGSDEGKKLVAHELVHVEQNKNVFEVLPSIFRQTTGATGTPGGFDPCFDLLQQIIELLNEVAQRFNDALDDRHNLFRYHRRVKDAHPDYGSWDGHRNRFNYDRDRLRQKISEWESNDDCQNYRLSKDQQEDLNEAYEFKEKEFPERPVRIMRKVEPETETSRSRINWETVYNVVIALGLSITMVGVILAALADPEPASKLALAGLSVVMIGKVLQAFGIRQKNEST